MIFKAAPLNRSPFSVEEREKWHVIFFLRRIFWKLNGPVCSSLRWSSRCRRWLWWRRWASWGGCSWDQSRSWRCREPPRHRPRSGSWEDHQSLPAVRAMVFRWGLINVKLYQYRVFKSDSQTYVATRHDSISAGADHSLLHLVAPPVILGAGGVVHHGQESLLQGVGDGPTGCGEKRSGENVPLRRTVCFKFLTKLLHWYTDSGARETKLFFVSTFEM